MLPFIVSKQHLETRGGGVRKGSFLRFNQRGSNGSTALLIEAKIWDLFRKT